MAEVVRKSPQEEIVAERLKSQWHTLVQSVGGNSSLIDSEFEKMAREYRSEGRSYHNLLHIGSVDEMLNKYRRLSRNFVALKFAGDGHDVIYVPGSQTNELNSSNYMKGIMVKLGMPESVIAETKRIILLTKDHKTTDDDIDGKLMIDADFAILASPASDYDAYEQAIWREYVDSGKVSKEAFKIGREGFISSLLKQKRIFLTDEIRGESESLAKQNLQRELLRLAS